MTDEKKTGGATFLSKYGEKLALGVSLAALGIGTFVMFGLAGKDATAPVRNAAQKLKVELGNEHGDKKAPKPEHWLAQSEGPWNELVRPARAGNDWVASGNTIVDPKIKVAPNNPIKSYKIPDVLMKHVDVQVDHILVNWAIKEFSKEEKQKGAKEFDFGSITHFRLERETRGKWEVLEPRLEAKVLSYRDDKIDAKTPYSYKVTAYSTDQGYLERGNPDPKFAATANKDGVGNSAASASVQTYGLWKLSFANPFKSAPAVKGRVFITIEKFEKGVGKVTINRIHEEGDLIGTWGEGAGAQPTSIHKISVPPGRALQVDWNTGATLVKVQPLKLPIDIEKCRAKIGPQGNLGCEQVIEQRQVTTNLIVYSDADGKHEFYSPALPDKNEKCTAHGGRPKAAARAPIPADACNEPSEKQSFPIAKSPDVKPLGAGGQ